MIDKTKAITYNQIKLEISNWLIIRAELRKKKEWELADLIRKQVEWIYGAKVEDTEGGFTWTWKD